MMRGVAVKNQYSAIINNASSHQDLPITCFFFPQKIKILYLLLLLCTQFTVCVFVFVREVLCMENALYECV